MYLFRDKYLVFSVFKTFLAYIKTQFSTCIKVLRSDSGREYTSYEFLNFLFKKGIISQISSP